MSLHISCCRLVAGRSPPGPAPVLGPHAGSADAHAVVRELSGYPDAFLIVSTSQGPSRRTCSTSPRGRSSGWSRPSRPRSARPVRAMGAGRPPPLRRAAPAHPAAPHAGPSGYLPRRLLPWCCRPQHRALLRRAGYQVVQSRGNLVCASSRASCSCQAGCSSTTFMSRFVAAASILRPRVVMRHVS
jgi:hypothetical protein